MTSQIHLVIKALLELGPSQPALLGTYRLGLKSGYLRWKTNRDQRKYNYPLKDNALRPVFSIPDPGVLRSLLSDSEIEGLTHEADEIVAGKVRLFGADAVDLDVSPAGITGHWSKIAQHSPYRHPNHGNILDFKLIWEPARFCWVYPLGRAYLVTTDEKYAGAFWDFVLEFLEQNPPNYGANWVSAQEVALRLIAFVFAAAVFIRSPHSTSNRKILLAQSIAQHAARIPPTLSYARAQNNNHLLSEAAGLFTAGSVLTDHPAAEKWKQLGWRWFNHGLTRQVDPDGSYIQHSTNYHRMMLQLALWMNLLAGFQGLALPEKTLHCLGSATGWLLAMCDRNSGCVPNLGPNDGTYIMPLSSRPFADYRPVLAAAARVFLQQQPFPAGSWDEMTTWFETHQNVDSTPSQNAGLKLQNNLLRTPHILLSPGGESWSYLRAAHFNSRPGHADQLHLDLWWRGINIALDPGTYRYTADPPWDNALVHTSNHNTVTIEGSDQMTPAGRFLFLDWAQAQIIDSDLEPGTENLALTAQHDGYHKLGLRHQRKVTALRDGGWAVVDRVLSAKSEQASSSRIISLQLHWLLPDGEWRAGSTWLELVTPEGVIRLTFKQDGNQDPPQMSLVRAGECILGSAGSSPALGWYSPTYNVKIPAISVLIDVKGLIPLSVSTHWGLSGSK